MILSLHLSMLHQQTPISKIPPVGWTLNILENAHTKRGLLKVKCLHFLTHALPMVKKFKPVSVDTWATLSHHKFTTWASQDTMLSYLTPTLCSKSSTRLMLESYCPMRSIHSHNSSRTSSSWSSSLFPLSFKSGLSRSIQLLRSLNSPHLTMQRSSSALALECLASSGVRHHLLHCIGFLLRICPLSWFGTITINEVALTDEQESNSLVSALRKSHRQSVRSTVKKTDEFNRRESTRQQSIRKSRGMSRGMSLRASMRGEASGNNNKHGSRAINE